MCICNIYISIKDWSVPRNQQCHQFIQEPPVVTFYISSTGKGEFIYCNIIFVHVFKLVESVDKINK